ncbi:MAG TPA: hypothetical protein VJQ06_01515 [Rhizomicrobium sp.]|nr:hypothetical protein [Rhizomicrobium sp.]
MDMLSAEQAAQALKEAAAAERRSANAYHYDQSAPYCFLWGIVWLLGYGAQALFPPGPWLGWWWMGLSMTGAVVSTVIGRRQNVRRPGKSWRTGVLFGIIWLFTIALFAVLHPKNPLQIGAYFPLLFAAIYAALGLWMGLRYILVGVFMAVSTLGAYFYMREYFFHWMALVGGGSLLLTGLWMRRA